MHRLYPVVLHNRVSRSTISMGCGAPVSDPHSGDVLVLAGHIPHGSQDAKLILHIQEGGQLIKEQDTRVLSKGT